MKDIQDLPYYFLETKAIGLQAYFIYDVKRAVVLVVQLVAMPRYVEVFSGQPYLVAQGMLSGPCLIVLYFCCNLAV